MVETPHQFFFVLFYILSASFFLLSLDMQVHFFLTSSPERMTLEQLTAFTCYAIPSHAFLFILLHTVVLCLANSSCFLFSTSVKIDNSEAEKLGFLLLFRAILGEFHVVNTRGVRWSVFKSRRIQSNTRFYGSMMGLYFRCT